MKSLKPPRTELGQNRRSGKPSSFVDSLIAATTAFYGGVLQELHAYQPRAPRLKDDAEPPALDTDAEDAYSPARPATKA